MLPMFFLIYFQNRVHFSEKGRKDDTLIRTISASKNEKSFFLL
ncbi:hypothetical protein ABID52_001829 [Fictibacillus halophilus]|uniref:Uncharacterized protein n=1 Tax=Fictibacillus halophilus TaxID=1610490 RepID=A0ABV2LI45_9BACL